MSKFTHLLALGIAGVAAVVFAGLSVSPAAAAGVARPPEQGVITNTVTITMPIGVFDPVPGDNTSTDSSTVARQSDLAIGKSVSTSGVAGTPITYTIVVTNGGPSATTGLDLTDTLPAEVINATWTCVATAGSSCGAASGSGNLNLTANLQVNGRVTIIVLGLINSTTPSGLFSNSADVTPPGGTTDPNPSNNTTPAVTTTVTLESDLSLSKTLVGGAPIPGTVITYQVIVTNAGPSQAVNAPVVDTLPGALIGATWTCSASAGSSCGTASGSGNLNTTVTLAAAGGTATYLIQATINPAATGTLANSASITLPGGTTDPVPGDNGGSTTVTLTPQTNLNIQKTTPSNTAIPGTPFTYTLVITNNGPSFANTTPITDIVPAALISVTWNCAATAGSTCNTASGSGNNVLLTADLLAAGGRATVTISGLIDPAITGTVINTASVGAGNGAVDPNPGNNTDPAPITTLTPEADVWVTKTDGQLFAVPGLPITYTIFIGNNGPSLAPNVGVQDSVPLVVLGATWTCVSESGSSCGAASGSGNVSTTVTLAPNSTVTITVTGILSSTATSTFGMTRRVLGHAQPTSYRDDGHTAGGGIGLATLVTGPTVGVGRGDARVAARHPVGASPFATLTCACGTGAGRGAGGRDGLSPQTERVRDAVARAPYAPWRVGQVANDWVERALTGTLTNTVSLATPVGMTDPNLSNNSGTDSSSISEEADLGLTARAQPGTLADQQTFDYIITVHNYGPSASARATLTTTLPPSVQTVQYVIGLPIRRAPAISPLALLAQQPAGQTTREACSLPVCIVPLSLIEPGASVAITLNVTLAPQTSNPFSGRFFVLGDSLPDPYLENNSASAQVVILSNPPTATLTATPLPQATTVPQATTMPATGPGLSKLVAPQFVTPGSFVTFTISARAGNAALTNVTIEDTWPGALAYRSGTTTQGTLTYTRATGQVRVTIASLPANTEALITLSGQVNMTVTPPTQITNVAVMRVDGQAGPSAQTTLYVIPFAFPVTGVGELSARGWGVLAVIVGVLFLVRRRALHRPAPRGQAGSRGPNEAWILFGALVLFTVSLAACGLPAPSVYWARVFTRPTPPPITTPFGGQATTSLPSQVAPVATGTLAQGAPSPLSPPATLLPSVTSTPALPSTGAVTAPLPTPTPFLAQTFSQPEGAARLAIPALGLDKPIVTVPLMQGVWDSSVLQNNIGWLQSTGDGPGAGLAMVLAGHITIAKDVIGPFLNLATLPLEAEVIYTDAAGRRYRYQVASVEIVSPQDTARLYVPDGSQLLLTTCINWNRAARVYRDRLVVTAVLEQ